MNMHSPLSTTTILPLNLCPLFALTVQAVTGSASTMGAVNYEVDNAQSDGD